MIVGFTGTQVGMQEAQRAVFRSLITSLGMSQFHHGDCTGADIQAHTTVKRYTEAEIHVHPPNIDTKRAFAKGATFTYNALPYLERNRNIVSRCSLLIATPSGFKEELRSGTWTTVRYARKAGRHITIIYPDGSVEKVPGKTISSLF